MWLTAPSAQSSLFNVSIKPCEPPRFTGERGQDIVAWLHQVDDYLEFVQPDERQAVAYITLLLKDNARLWWEAELVARGYRRPDTVAELKLLLRTAFESPVREQRARSELLNLQQRTGKNASSYMARTRALLHKVPGYDERTALQQWVLGLRQPYRLEAAKQYPKTLAEAEALVARLEDAMEFAKGGRDDTQKKPQQKSSNDSGKQNMKNKQQWRAPEPQRAQYQGGNVVAGYRPQQYPPGLSNRGSGRGGPQQPGPHRNQPAASHPAARQNDGPGGRGRGRGRQQRPRLAYLQVREDGALVVVDEERPESTQQVDGQETVTFRGQSSEN